MVSIIPTQTTEGGEPFDQRIVLTGKPYQMRFQWSNRGAVWKLSLFNEAGELLLGGLSIVNGIPLLAPYRSNPNIPAGELIALASTKAEQDAFRGDLGSRVLLYYVEA